MDPQFLLVLVLVILAAGYAGWRFLRQFTRAEDESSACARCPAARGPVFTVTDGNTPEPSNGCPPHDGPQG